MTVRYFNAGLLVLCIGHLLPETVFADRMYADNLERAKAFIQYQQEEKLQDQVDLYAQNVIVQSPQYGARDLDREGARAMLSNYHDLFDDMKFSDAQWLPGVSESGELDGSISVFGTWTGRNADNGTSVELSSFHRFSFNSVGEISTHEDYFDFSGMMEAATPRNPVIVSLAIAPGQLQAALDVLDSPEGLPLTRDWPGCVSLTRFVNQETNTIWVISTWDKYDSYGEYLDWRQNHDTFVTEKINPLLADSDLAVSIVHPNAFIKDY